MKLEEMNPEQLRAYIKELREENRQAREQVEAYTEAMKEFDEPQQRGLLRMIKTLGEDPDSGAKMFRELADNILSNNDEEETKQGEENVEPEDLEALVAKAVTEALEAKSQADAKAKAEAEEEAFKAQVAYWDAQAKELGYEPNTPEAADLFFMANKMDTTDLKAADAELKRFQEFRNASTGDKKDEKKKDEEDPKEFPKTAGKGTVGAPAGEKQEIDFKDDKAVRSAVFAMIADADDDGM